MGNRLIWYQISGGLGIIRIYKVSGFITCRFKSAAEIQEEELLPNNQFVNTVSSRNSLCCLIFDSVMTDRLYGVYSNITAAGCEGVFYKEQQVLILGLILSAAEIQEEELLPNNQFVNTVSSRNSLCCLVFDSVMTE
ncbi:hypothetical protein Tco_1562625 [Tanacetum coccineum]